MKTTYYIQALKADHSQRAMGKPHDTLQLAIRHYNLNKHHYDKGQERVILEITETVKVYGTDGKSL